MKAKPVILVVDDQPQNIELLEAYLVPQGYEIVKAANGEEALEKLSGNQIDLILLDVTMPGIDGFEVTRRVRRDDKKRLLPIILVTALREREDRVKGIEAGCDDFISKPVDQMELLARIRSLLKVKDYNDLMSNYQKELESEATRRTKELKHALENLQQEITNRKQVEVTIAEQNARLLSILNSPTDILIFSLDRNYCYTGFNENHRKAMRSVWQADIRIGMNILECMTIPELRDAARTSIDRVLAGENFQEVQYQQNMDIWFEFNWNPIRDLSDVVVGTSAFIRDITARKKAEEEIVSLAKFPAENPNPVLRVNRQGALMYANKSALPLLHEWKIEVGKVLPQIYTKTILNALDSGSVERLEAKVGDQIFMFTIAPILGADYVNLYGLDITERQKAEDSLRESEKFNAGLLEHSLNPIYVINSDTSIKYVNPAFVNLTGFTPDELLGKMPPYPWWPLDNQAEYRSSQQQSRNGVGHRTERLYQKKNGDKLWIDTSIAAVGEEPNKYFIANWVDITEREKGEEALKKSEEFNTILRENSPAPIIVINPDSSVTYVNPAFEKITGFSASEVVGISPPFPWWIQEDVEHPDRVFKVSPTDHFYGMERHMRSKSGEDFWVELSAVPVIINGEFKFHLSNWIDITNRKKAEEERQRLEEKAQIASRLAAVGGMAAGIAHEINNPLTGVLGFSKLLLEKENLPEDLKEDLKVIADGSQRVADIVRRLLTFARQMKPLRTSVNLNELIDNTLKLRDYVLKTANIEVVTHFDPELPWSTVDPGQLQQVFLNLVINAEYAMKEAHGKGILIITTEKQENNVCILFQDDGPGITKENLHHIFEPFFTTKAPGEGTGLGLSLSRSIVLEHGGEMHVESEPGQGASFIIKLPIIEVLSPEADVPSPVATVKTAERKNGRILMVDDEPGVRELIEKVLTQTGYLVDTFGDAQEALDKLAGVKYDAILADIRMPGISGMELYARIQEKAPAMVNRIIFITGDIMGEDIKTFLTQNNLAYLAKPFDIQALKEKVDRVIKAGQPENDRPDRKGP